VSDMGSWQRWLRAPQTLPLRRLLFQVHLWLGIGVGLYVLLISVSGSAIVLRPQIARWFTPSEVPAIVGAPLQGAELAARVTAVYVDARVVRISEPQREGRSTYVLLERDGREQSRYFDQYSGQDLGPTFPWQVATVEWLTRLHDDLLLDRPGRRWNGVGGLLFLGMVASGMVLWWQGSSRWQDGLLIRRSSRRSLFWQLHSALGFWSLLLLFIWGFTAVYFAWPEPFDRFIDFLDEDLQDDTRPDSWLLWMIQLHFGRFRGLLWANVLWIVLGLLPAILYVSGFVLWYRRVLRVWWRQQVSGTP
jgi:uncharacterized iron-regulated membrane protein